MSNLFIVFSSALVVLLSPLLPLYASDGATPGEPALIIARPWGPKAEEIAERAGVPELPPERAMMGTIVIPESAQSIVRLYENGAWFVVGGERVLALCLN